MMRKVDEKRSTNVLTDCSGRLTLGAARNRACEAVESHLADMSVEQASALPSTASTQRRTYQTDTLWGAGPVSRQSSRRASAPALHATMSTLRGLPRTLTSLVDRIDEHVWCNVSSTSRASLCTHLSSATSRRLAPAQSLLRALAPCSSAAPSACPSTRLDGQATTVRHIRPKT